MFNPRNNDTPLSLCDPPLAIRWYPLPAGNVCHLCPTIVSLILIIGTHWHLLSTTTISLTPLPLFRFCTFLPSCFGPPLPPLLPPHSLRFLLHSSALPSALSPPASCLPPLASAPMPIYLAPPSLRPQSSNHAPAVSAITRASLLSTCNCR